MVVQTLGKRQRTYIQVNIFKPDGDVMMLPLYKIEVVRRAFFKISPCDLIQKSRIAESRKADRYLLIAVVFYCSDLFDQGIILSAC